MKSHTILLFFFLLIGVANAQSPLFSVQPSNTTVEPGQEATLACKFTSQPSNCFWSFQKYQSRPLPFTPNNDEVVFVNPQPNADCSIRIPSPQLKHDGLYQCGYVAGINEGNLVSKQAKLSILDVPEKPQIQFRNVFLSDMDVIKLSGIDTQTTFKCVVRDGNPEAIMRWYLDSQELYGANTTYPNSSIPYLISTTSEYNLSVSNLPQYSYLSCNATHIAYNVANKMMSTTVVLVKPGPVSRAIASFGNDTFGESIRVPSGYKVQLNCTAYSDPDPDYIWEKRSSGNSEWQQFSTAAIQEYNAETGFYRCGARNNLNGNSYEYSTEILQITVDGGGDDGGLSGGAIAGIVIGCVLGVALVVGGIFYLYRKRKLCFKGRAPPMTTRRTPQVYNAPKYHAENQPLRDIKIQSHDSPKPLVQEYKDRVDKAAHDDLNSTATASAKSS